MKTRPVAISDKTAGLLEGQRGRGVAEVRRYQGALVLGGFETRIFFLHVTFL